MKLYLMGHNVECTEREVVEFIKEQVSVLQNAVSDYDNPFNR